MKNASFLLFLHVGILFCWSVECPAASPPCQFPGEWLSLCPIAQSRIYQKSPKMKLQASDVQALSLFLSQDHSTWVYMQQLRKLAPKTTLELLFSLRFRDLSMEEAEKMANYLLELLQKFQFQYPSKFDTNTSHLVGRKWHEIDYSGEGMTWQSQKKKYQPYGVLDFRTKENLAAFFKIESKLPYFKKIYQPKFT